VSFRQRIVVLVVASLMIVGCSSSDDESSSDNANSEQEVATEQEPNHEAAPPEPKPKAKNGTLAAMISCAKSAGYAVDRRERNLIVITGDPGQGQMNVERMPSHAEASAAAKAADLIESRVVGRLWLKYSAPEGDSLRTDVDTCALTGSPD
jgi:type IV secretory pathway VirJ component